MNVATIPAVPGARHRKKRVGRGIGSGHGKTATRGQKGQRARTGEGKRPGFEGGRNPLIRRIPKRGFRYKATGRPLPPQIIHVNQLNRYQEGERVTVDRLKSLRLIEEINRPVKLLGDGALTKRLTVVIHEASASAKAKVQQAGGSIEFIDNPRTAQGSGVGVQGTVQPRAQRSEPSG